ncbi:MAG: hypothetical protein AAGF96_12910 [Bacteroidota bacterium]
MKISYTNLLLITLFTVVTLSGQQSIFNANQSMILSEDNERVSYKDTIFKGKQALKLDGKSSSIAFLEGLEASNFRVEMDIAGEIMSGLGFHANDGFNYQFIYFRPGMGGTREAIQYIPIYNGALSWVFYNYPIYETIAEVKSLEWFHAAFEVRGNNLKVFVNDEKDPKMDITLLDNPIKGGKLLLRSLFGPSYFANVTYRSLPEEDRGKRSVPNEAFLTAWEISGEFPRADSATDFENILNQANAAKEWKRIDVPEDNYVNLSRYFDYPKGVVVAKTTITSETDIRKKLHFDFVGRVQLLLNGNIFFDYHKIRFERMFDGSFTIGLPLKKGDNELTVIAEGDASFFGKGFRYLGRDQHTNWGFIARLDD